MARPSTQEVLDAVGRWYTHNYGLRELREAGLSTSAIDIGKRLKDNMPAHAFKAIVDEISDYPEWKAGAILPIVNMHRGKRQGDYEATVDGWLYTIDGRRGLDTERMSKVLWLVSTETETGLATVDHQFRTKDDAVMQVRQLVANRRAGKPLYL